MKIYNKLIIVLLGVLISIFVLVSKPYPASERFASYPYTLNEAVEKVLELPEVRDLLEKVQNDNGRIGVEMRTVPGADFTAFWDGEHRVIILNPKKNEALSAQITSILFELHNAASNDQFMMLADEASQKVVDKQNYVKQMEWIEHQNTLKVGKLIKLGQERGIFPQDIVWRFSSDFNFHFKRQLESGHAAWHAKNYDHLAT